jgi:hypothetical protein
VCRACPLRGSDSLPAEHPGSASQRCEAPTCRRSRASALHESHQVVCATRPDDRGDRSRERCGRRDDENDTPEADRDQDTDENEGGAGQRTEALA